MIKKIVESFKKWVKGSPPPNYFGQNNKKEPEKTKSFVPNQRVGKENMTDEEILKQGFNGNTYSINGRDVDF